MTDKEDKRANFIQDCESARHYGQLRFTMFTVFTAILGGLMSVELRKEPLLGEEYLFVWFRWVSLLLAILFCAAQFRISQLIVFYQKRANHFTKELDLHLPPGHDVWKYIIPFIMMAPFLTAAIFWIVCLTFFGSRRIG